MHLPPQLLNLLSAQDVSDVLVNGPNDAFVVSNNRLIAIRNPFLTESNLIDFAKDLVDLGGDHLDFANPICDVSIRAKDVPELSGIGVSGLRIHASLALGIGDQNLISIRVHRFRAIPLDSFGDPDLLSQIASEGSYLVSGMAGAGKTSLLRAMLSVRPDLRTVVIEDSPELLPIQGHFLGLNVRRPNSEGAGEISLQRLLTESLRMRPQRIVLGEVRSHEVATALQALNVGAAQVAFTIHANAAAEVKPRLLALWLASGGLAQNFEALIARQQLTVLHVSNHQVVQIARLS